MTKAKTNALEALRALIAERQQYEQWISTLQSKREMTPAHVFDRVQGDYNTRLQRVLTDIKGHAEELQLSISTLSSRLVEVAREEDTRRDALQEAELRATVGEYEPQQWEQLKVDAEKGLEAVASDRASLDAQLTELRSIQKLSEVGSTGNVADVAAAPAPASEAPAAIANEKPAEASSVAPSSAQTESTAASAPVTQPPRDQGHLPLEQQSSAAKQAEQPSAAPVSASVPSNNGPMTAEKPVVPAPAPVTPVSNAPASNAPASNAPASSAAPQTSPPRARTGKTPPFGSPQGRKTPGESRTDQSKTLKCPECGTPNYPTEWYCERCGGELATM